MKNLIFVLTSLLAMATLGVVSAISFQVGNKAGGTAGGTRFQQQISIQYTINTMSVSTHFIWSTFLQAPTDRKDISAVALYVESINGVAFTSGNEIHVSASYIAGYSGNVKTEFTGVLYHEMTHVWQWNGQNNAPSGLIEGIADFVRLKAGYAPSHWVNPGQGDRWDQGYDVTAHFLDYCNGLKHGFVGHLNAKMKDGYSNDFFVQLLGKTVDQLWSDYKKKYGN